MPDADRTRSGSQIVRDYLAAMEARDLDRAKAMLGPGFAMTFPGPARLDSLEALVEWSKDRYRSVGKTYERFDECPAEDGAESEAPAETIVYCYGHLHGVWNDGTAFDGIRFIDRFAIRDGLIVDQKVWNDLAEVMRREGRG